MSVFWNHLIFSIQLLKKPKNSIISKIIKKYCHFSDSINDDEKLLIKFASEILVFFAKYEYV